jgi:alginate O-acetyltransferase complex protein AlgI
MVFTDWIFYVFFAVAFTVYWSIQENKWRKIWLLACSVVFYSAWDWRFVGLVLVVVVNTYAVTRLVGEWAPDSRRKPILVAGIVVSLSVLGFFKYYNFFVVSLAHFLPVDAAMANIVLPIGISFYTFHSLSYMIDSYRRRIVPTRSFIDVALYILFFPQLVAGPIVRATDLLPQMREARSFGAVDFKYFLAMFLIGYFKKAVISDNLSPFVDQFFAHPDKFGGGDGVEAMLLYATQIYCDFSGYTDMAIAVAGMLGFRLKPNFDHPYLAPSLIEFWRRWHMSLSFWLRDYLYIPLGGNRGGPAMQARNIIITMLLGGLWHGASWTFVIWGGVHGIGLVVCRAWQTLREWYQPGYGPHYTVAGNLLTFSYVCAAWMAFRSPDFANLAAIVERFSSWTKPMLIAWTVFLPLAAMLLTVHVLFYRVDLSALTEKANNNIFACAYGAAIAIVLPFVNVTIKPFIYFQF